MITAKAKVIKRPAKQRDGRGFSRNELQKAGSNPTEALKLHIPLDLKRRTLHEENVACIKNILTSRRKQSKPKVKKKTKS
jgi:ribosomal protein L13E